MFMYHQRVGALVKSGTRIFGGFWLRSCQKIMSISFVVTSSKIFHWGRRRKRREALLSWWQDHPTPSFLLGFYFLIQFGVFCIFMDIVGNALDYFCRKRFGGIASKDIG